jgi:hypothetical protein
MVVLSAVCCLLCAVCCVLSAVCCVLCAVCCVLSAMCYVVCAVCCVLRAVCCAVCAVCCVLCAVCCVLRAVRCVLCAICCVLCCVCCGRKECRLNHLSVGSPLSPKPLIYLMVLNAVKLNLSILLYSTHILKTTCKNADKNGRKSNLNKVYIKICYNTKLS